jgi:SAM-dependent methyltransferase
LADRGWTVTGVDRTRRYLDRARAHGGAVEWIEADAREFRRPAAFDLAVNLWTSLGYFETPEEDLAVLRNVRASLGEGGVFVIEMQGREVLCRTWKHREWYEVEGTLVFEERRPVDAWERIESRWVVVRDGVQREVTLAIRSYTGSMLRAALRDAGFANVQLLGGLDGRPYDHEALRLVAVARP